MARGVDAACAAPRRLRALALIACAGLLGACGSTGAAPTLSVDSLSAAQSTAFDQASEAVLAYRQTVADLYTGQRTELEDLTTVAVAPEFGAAARDISRARTLGFHSRPTGAKIVLVSSEPQDVDLDASPPSVLLWACIDATAVTAVAPSGLRREGARERQQYRVVIDGSDEAQPTWKVSEVNAGSARDQDC